MIEQQEAPGASTPPRPLPPLPDECYPPGSQAIPVRFASGSDETPPARRCAYCTAPLDHGGNCTGVCGPPWDWEDDR